MLIPNLPIQAAPRHVRSGRPQGSLGLRYLLVLVAVVSAARGQARPAEGLHQYTPRLYALADATIYLEPGKVLARGTLLLRDGLIEAVGSRVDLPPGATIVPLAGKFVYPGFIESFWELGPPRNGSDTDSPTEARPATRHWNNRVHASRSVLDHLQPDSTDLAALRALGFTAAHVVASRGVFRGGTALIDLGDWSPGAPLGADVTQAMAFEHGRWPDRDYPNSLLGSIALIRQTILDSQWYSRSWGVYKRYPQYNERPEVNADLAALAAALAANKPLLFTTDDELATLRAGAIAAEFGVPLWVAGNGYEYRRLQNLKELNAFFIVPLPFPSAPQVATLEDELQVSLADLRHWDQAPDNLQRLAQAGIPFALTSSKLAERSDFKSYLARAVERGLDADLALAALTTVPAERLGLAASHGKIAKGFVANLFITDGDYFSGDSKVEAVWVEGKPYPLKAESVEDFRGQWTVEIPLTGDAASESPLTIESQGDTLIGYIQWRGARVPLVGLKQKGAAVSWTLTADSIGLEGVWRLSGTLLDDTAYGTGSRTDGSLFTWTATRSSGPPAQPKDEPQPAAPEKASLLQPLFPEGAFGRTEPPEQPAYVLVRNATIWTAGPQGTLEAADLLIQGGKISAVGPGLALPRRPKGTVVEIDAAGRHVTPGLIDAHSHSALEAVNEGTQSVTAEVRIRDVIDSDDIAIYRELAGGLTTANLLHGSANAIGGQNAVIKLRWGAVPADLIFQQAPQGIKFALGENVKQSNWGDEFVTRYPQTRMGVDQIIRDAFRAAGDYRRLWETYGASRTLKTTHVPPRRDLEMDALVEILEGKRWVHCHSYRQDEILNLIRIADHFGFTIGTFQHVLEGYKVAPEIAAHGAGASCFSDWWAYKFEVYDAIPYNGALMTRAGVVTSFNSDSGELARHLNTEGSKAVKYGGLSEQDALKIVTINPARQLKIDRYVGSLEPGKDADFVIWSEHPLSTYSRCEQTWIDGRKYFDVADDRVMRHQQSAERAGLIQMALKAAAEGGEDTTHSPGQSWGNRRGDGCLWDMTTRDRP